MTDVLLVGNGTILTMDPELPEVEAFGVIDDRIVAVGNRRLVEDALPRGYRTVDLAGRCAVPGFNEAHNHMISYGMTLEHIDASFPAVKSIRDIVAAVRERAATTPKGRWIIGRGYDDGLVSALAILDMLDRNPGKSMADLRRALPQTWGSPTMSPHCDDETKYAVVDKVVRDFQNMRERGEPVAGQPIRELITVNGVRVVAEDGTWGLVRASSNKPELVVVIESPVSEQRMRDMFKGIDAVLRRNPEVGAYNQTI